MDFDKTITRAHTNGGVQMPAFATEEYIASNFADLKLFQWLVPFCINQDAKVGIASFGGHQDGMLLSGLPLIRKYLDVAFGEANSKKYIPDDMIAVRGGKHTQNGETHTGLSYPFFCPHCMVPVT